VNGGVANMIRGKKVTVVMPAYNAEKTLKRTYDEIPHEIVDSTVLVDDGSWDHTVEVAEGLNIRTVIHPRNMGYGANQKTCYATALDLDTDIVVMLHPDYQYTPRLITAMVSLIAEGLFDCVLGSRILGVGALKGGMPRYKYISNRALTFVENILLQHKLSEYHTGYRAFSREILESLPINVNSDDFVFDNQMLAQIIYAGYSIGEISCPARYEEGSSSINFARSVVYGLGVLKTAFLFRLCRWGLISHSLFSNIRPPDKPSSG
jgi:glycosyltransferase involved in cell wall biosynthesis